MKDENIDYKEYNRLLLDFYLSCMVKEGLAVGAYRPGQTLPAKLIYGEALKEDFPHLIKYEYSIPENFNLKANLRQWIDSVLDRLLWSDRIRSLDEALFCLWGLVKQLVQVLEEIAAMPREPVSVGCRTRIPREVQSAVKERITASALNRMCPPAMFYTEITDPLPYAVKLLLAEPLPWRFDDRMLMAELYLIPFHSAAVRDVFLAKLAWFFKCPRS